MIKFAARLAKAHEPAVAHVFGSLKNFRVCVYVGGQIRADQIGLVAEQFHIKPPRELTLPPAEFDFIRRPSRVPPSYPIRACARGCRPSA